LYDITADRCSIARNDTEDDMSDLIIRPGHNDHRVIASLLFDAGGVQQLRPAIHRLVLDAHVAARQPEFVRVAEHGGTPVLIDPLTFLLQSQVRDEDPWCRLPFSRPAALPGTELEQADFQLQLVDQVVTFELEYGATGIIAPYLLLADDPRLLEVNLELMKRTRQFMDDRDIQLPLVVIIAVTAGRTVGDLSLRKAVERLAHEATLSGAKNVALAMSGTGGPDDGAERVHLLLEAVRHLVSLGTNVLAWRQGLLGPASVAAGAAGYECGIGIRERCDLKSLQNNRRPGPNRSGFAPPAGVFLQPFGRSVSRPVARELLEDRKLLPRLVCDDERCCPLGMDSMLKDPRRHAVLARSRALAELDRMPSREWRLNAVAREAENGAVLAELATRILGDRGRREVISSRALGAISAAADLFREEGGRGVA
jgi:hypothetical protein